MRTTMLAVALVSLLTAPAAAVELARFTVDQGITPPAGTGPPPYRYGFTTGPVMELPPGACLCDPILDGPLFDALVSAAGQTFITDATDPDFAKVEARLTNGVDDWLWLGFSDLGFFALPEFGRLGGHDLAGADLERITLHIDAFRFDPAAEIQTLLTTTLIFEGAPAAVPAPWPLALLGAGLIGIAYRTRGVVR